MNINKFELGQWSVLSLITPEEALFKVLSGEFKAGDADDNGKWMHRFTPDKFDEVEALCQEAIEGGYAFEAKLVRAELAQAQGYGVACFYCKAERAEMRKLLEWMIAHDLVQKTKAGKWFNIRFDTTKEKGFACLNEVLVDA